MEEIFRGTEAEAETFIKDKGCIRRGKNRHGTMYYRCRSYRDHPSCKISMKTEYDGEVVIVHGKGSHAHDEVVPQGIPSPAREKVKLYSTSGCSTQQMRRILTGEGLDIPTPLQLRNAAAYDRRTSSSLPSNLDAADARAWCLANSQVPDDPHKMFVLPGFRVNSADDCFIFLTTRYLLLRTSKHPFIQIDCTYKLLINDCPVMVGGTSDLDRHFHAYGLAIVDSDEKTSTYREFFAAIKFGANLVNPEFTFTPKYVMGDGCPAITRAVRDEFPEAIRLMCWPHVLRNVDKHKGKGFPKKESSDFERDINILQVCHSPEQFNVGVDLFCAKWGYVDSEIVTRFFGYFRDQYFALLPLWYEGASPMYPSTNNGLESCNSKIKKLNTQHRRLNFSSFLSECTTLFPEWSQRSFVDGFIETPTSDTHNLRVSAKQWLETDAGKSVERLAHGILVVRGAEADMNFGAWMYHFCTHNFLDFAEFSSYVRSYYLVQLSDDGSLSCSCPIGLKEYVCKHTVAINANYFGPGLPASMNAKRKAGRPKKVGPALSLQ